MILATMRRFDGYDAVRWQWGLRPADTWITPLSGYIRTTCRLTTPAMPTNRRRYEGRGVPPRVRPRQARWARKSRLAPRHSPAVGCKGG
jgi:hypothetical protein